MFMQGLSERFSKAVSKVILCRNVGKKNTISRDILIADIKVFNFITLNRVLRGLYSASIILENSNWRWQIE